jgi:hypothetical protein
VPAERVPALISAVLAGFDTDEPTALRWLNESHRLMVKRSQCYRKRIALGTTAAAVGSYALPAEVVEVVEVLVGGLPYGRGRHSDIAFSAQGWLMLSGIGGVAVEDESAGGAYELALVPAPVEGGAAIEVYAVCRAPTLLAGDDTTLKVPQDFDGGVLAGAMALGMERLESRFDLAASFTTKYEAQTTELLREMRQRNRPRQARVTGFNA